ncbi:hypothetical protein UFOVP861_23 [uncultured Caudovirales phage]|uniref:Uncharacterized protein n=1 Tax=uncultured Caudovirales phage TaxID=2100421 RepID=A0A6J5PDX3_9CAUD|nr:hypothetical protein UFOVP861_23 [uncultured Caudovirales phage]
MTSITFPIDEANRQTTYTKGADGIWKGAERYTLQANQIEFIEVDEDLAEALEKILAREIKNLADSGHNPTSLEIILPNPRH